MKKNYLLPFCILILSSLPVFSQTVPPKQEFRGAWIATVVNIDWPTTNGTENQKAELVELLDDLQAAGINAVNFQVRPACDAFYQSDLEPWSVWLTGQQGQAPVPFYDPLAFAIEEAHKRGMELHAWFNPFRADRGGYTLADNHVVNTHPEWILDCSTGTGKAIATEAYNEDAIYREKLEKSLGIWIMLNPGLAEVRQYIVDVYMDVANRYDVDGLHMDDYFYPYDGMSGQDSDTYQADKRGFRSISDWRRDNINLFVQAVYDSLQKVKPQVKFGISPFGIWRNGVPAGITGLDAYSVIYCDAMAWLDDKSLDYLVPQLYWPFGGGQDYGKLQPWWADKCGSANRHFYTGQAVYRIPNWSSYSELPNQIRLNREETNCQGSVFFSAVHFQANHNGFVDSLQNDFYRYPALTPVMAWKDQSVPETPQNLRFDLMANGISTGLIWDAVNDGIARKYAVYAFPTAAPSTDDFENPVYLAGVTYENQFLPPVNMGAAALYYAVRSASANSVESAPTAAIAMDAPGAVALISPTHPDSLQTASIALIWHVASEASQYELDIALDESFSQLVHHSDALVDTLFTWNDSQGMTDYYWRVRGVNGGGYGPFSEAGYFRTGYPAVPVLLYPENNVGGIETTPVFTWRNSGQNISYHLQIAISADFRESSILVDSTGLADTTYANLSLAYSRFHFWRLKAVNNLGASAWSDVNRFKTEDESAVDAAEGQPRELMLYGNYPNPFNPVTTIVFDVDKSREISVKVYNLLGSEVAALVEDTLPAGRHTLSFNGSGLASGIYFVRLQADDRTMIQKMILSK